VPGELETIIKLEAYILQFIPRILATIDNRLPEPQLRRPDV